MSTLAVRLYAARSRFTSAFHHFFNFSSPLNFIVGIIENIGGAYIVGTELKLSMALFIIVAVLVVKPAGLFGKTVVSRV